MKNLSLFTQYLETEKKACLAKTDSLEQSGCQDEANWTKIRANIFEAFFAVASAAEKRFPDKAAPFLQEKMNSIPEAWRKMLETAKAHGDHAQVTVETIKLETAAEISRKFAGLLEEAK